MERLLALSSSFAVTRADADAGSLRGPNEELGTEDWHQQDAGLRVWCSAARPPLPPPTPWYPPSSPMLPCGVGSPPAPPPVVAVSCAFHGYCWLGVRLLRVWTLGCDTVPLNFDLP